VKAKSLTTLAAIGLIAIMFGAIGKRVFAGHIGFWGGKSDGLHYDWMFVLMNLVIVFVFTNRGAHVLLK
jgi:putative oxidoreductase